MADFFLRMGANKAARALVRGLHLPLPLPQALERVTGPWTATPLRGRAVVLGQAGGSLCKIIAKILAEAGAETWRDSSAADLNIPNARTFDATNIPDALRPHALVFDASALTNPDALEAIHGFLHPHVRGLRPCGRVVVALRPPDTAANAAERATRRAVEGIVRSLGKELGRKGATANIVHVEAGAEQRIDPVLRFLLSESSAYVSGQCLHVSTRVPCGEDVHYEQALCGKTALVTGAARGIGEATARALAREGAHVVVMDRPADIAAADRVAQSIGGSALACDVTDANAAQTIRDFVSQRGLDIIVHNAGITRDKMLANMDEARWRTVLEVNLAALIRVNEALRDTLRDNGRIVCLSSIGGIAGNVGQTNYAASKAGVIGYVQALAAELAPRGIAVNAVAPGFIETQMTAAIPLATREVARRLCSLSQGGLPEDIAEAITFLASPGAAAMSGEVLRVCGGNFIGA